MSAIFRSWDSITTILSLMQVKLEANITIYYLLIQLKATLPNSPKRLQDKLSEIYLLPINVSMETYLRDFQDKVPNYIIFC